MAISLPKIYPILDASFIPATGRAEFLRRLGGELAAAGVTLLEYRNKNGPEAELLGDAEILRSALPAGQVKLILDDRADLIEQIGFDGVHVDAGDLPPAEARLLLGPDRIVGTFGGGHSLSLPGIGSSAYRARSPHRARSVDFHSQYPSANPAAKKILMAAR